MARHQRIATMWNAYSCNNPDIKMHHSMLFFVKGRPGKYNGVVMSKLLPEVEFMSVYQDGKEIETNHKIFYFENGSELRIYLVDGEVRRFVFSPSKGEFEEVFNGLRTTFDSSEKEEAL